MDSMEQNRNGGTEGADQWGAMAAEGRLEKARECIREIGLSEEQRQQTFDAVADMEKRYGRQLTDSELETIIKAEATFYGVARLVDYRGFPATADGRVFERGVTKLLIDEFGYDERRDGVFSVRERNMTTRKANIAEDVLEGTDVVVRELPVDITLSAEKRGVIGSIDEGGNVQEGYTVVGNIDDVVVRSGFRMANGEHELLMPVCVMLFEGAQGRMPVGNILEKLRRFPTAFRELAEKATSSYWDYADAMEVVA